MDLSEAPQALLGEQLASHPSFPKLRALPGFALLLMPYPGALENTPRSGL